MFSDFFNYRRAMTGLMLLFSAYFYTRIPETKKDLVLVIVIGTTGLLTFGFSQGLASSIRSDFVKSSKSFATFKKKCLLFVIWLCSLFLGVKAGVFPWLFDSFDQATLLAFSLIPSLFIFHLSGKTLIFLTIIAWVYTTFFSLYKFEDQTTHFSILTFWLFFLAVTVSLIDVRKTQKYA